MNILITGGCGYIGSVLTGELLNDHNVYVVDNLRYKQVGLLQYCSNPRFDFLQGDVREERLLYSLCDRSDVIIPLAAIVGAPACNEDPDLARAVNYKHVKFIAENFSDKIILYPCSNSGYGIGQGDKHCTEESPMNPVSLYGKTKCDAEKSVLAAGGISLRLATICGASTKMRLDLLVNDFVYKAMSDGYIVLFEKDFKRNYIHIKDVVSAFIFMLKNYSKCKGNAYNVGLSSANLTKYELALKIKEHIPNFSIQVDDIKQDPDKRNYIISNDKIEKLGWQPKYTLDDAIVELQKAFRMLFTSQQRYTNL